MESHPGKQISRIVSDFHGRRLPEGESHLVGYAALIDAYQLKVPSPERLAAISRRHRRYDTDEWAVYTPRHAPDDTVAGHLTFALRYEGVDLSVLRALFTSIGGAPIEEWLRREPVGRYSRRIWFFYEWLLDQKLDLPDAKTGNHVEALDSKHYVVGPATSSRRHRVKDNLPGVRDFCPLVRRTEKIQEFLAQNWQARAREQSGKVHPDVLARAAAFLLLHDSRSSFEIEGEKPGINRTERWGEAIAQAGLHPLSIQELLRLQSIVIGDTRFLKMGLRKEGGFIGTHDRRTGLPLPAHISARWQDLERLLHALIATDERLRRSTFEPVVAAGMIAFGFVFIHPFTDGNGRLHRYLIHHVLAENEFNPKGIVFPISAVILDRLDEYRRVLEACSRPRLRHIHWRPTEDGNLEVLNETIDLYRYFDATRQVEFLCDCVAETIEHSLPEEIRFLERYDRMKAAIDELFDMPDHTADLLIRFLVQNDGALSKRARENEFKKLSIAECGRLEALYREIFGSDG